MPLTQWLYISETVGTPTLDTLVAIQHVAIRNNARQNLTGLLLRCEGHFLHFIEGEEASVSDTYDRVSVDPRHADVRLLYKRYAERRHFEPWHMAMLDLDLHTPAERADFWAIVDAAADQQIGPIRKDLFFLDRFADLLSDGGVSASNKPTE